MTDRINSDRIYTGAHDFSGATGTVPPNSVTDAALPTTAAVARTKLATDTGVFNIDILNLRVHDAISSLLPTAASADDLGVISGTFGTATPTVQGSDFGATSITQYARIFYALPAEYKSGGTITIRARGGMLTTVADTSCTLDLEAYAHDGDGAVGSDLCTTSATSINSLTFANKDFTVTPTGLAAGDTLDLRFTIAGTDAGDLGVMTPEITNLELRCSIQG